MERGDAIKVDAAEWINGNIDYSRQGSAQDQLSCLHYDMQTLALQGVDRQTIYGVYQEYIKTIYVDP
jgi:hypothetical protein